MGNRAARSEIPLATWSVVAMVEFFYFSVVVGQILGWIYLCPRSELLADAYWRHCLFLDCPK
jgi:hypothetical protein